MAQNTLLIFLLGLEKITRKTKYYILAKTEIDFVFMSKGYFSEFQREDVQMKIKYSQILNCQILLNISKEL